MSDLERKAAVRAASKVNELLGRMALEALGNVYDDMLSAAKGGDEWAAEWLVDVWGHFPTPLRQALGDTDATWGTT